MSPGVAHGDHHSALGVAEICKAAGVPKGRFYYFFESKEALAPAVIDEHWVGRQREWTGILNSDAEPLHRLRQLFEATEAASAPAGRAVAPSGLSVLARRRRHWPAADSHPPGAAGSTRG